MTPTALFGGGADLDEGIAAMCGPCRRYHHCGAWMSGWVRPELDRPEWTATGGTVACSLLELPVPKPSRLPSHVYPASAQMDRRGLPLGRVGADGRLQVGGKETYHGAGEPC